MMWGLRKWMIRRLAGDRTIVINATIVDGAVYAKSGGINYFCGCRFHAVDVWCDGELLISREKGLPFRNGLLTTQGRAPEPPEVSK